MPCTHLPFRTQAVIPGHFFSPNVPSPTGFQPGLFRSYCRKREPQIFRGSKWARLVKPRKKLLVITNDAQRNTCLRCNLVVFFIVGGSDLGVGMGSRRPTACSVFCPARDGLLPFAPTLNKAVKLMYHRARPTVRSSRHTANYTTVCFCLDTSWSQIHKRTQCSLHNKGPDQLAHFAWKYRVQTQRVARRCSSSTPTLPASSVSLVFTCVCRHPSSVFGGTKQGMQSSS